MDDALRPQSVVLMSHLGRPDGLRDDSMSMRPVADKLQARGVHGPRVAAFHRN